MAEIRLAGSRIIGLNAKRNSDFDGKINLKTALHRKQTEYMKQSKDTLEVGYVFEVDYGDLGSVSVEGILYISGDSKTIKTIKKTSDKKEFDNKEQIAITNLIIQKASVKALELEDELGLPVHFRLPSISSK